MIDGYYYGRHVLVDWLSLIMVFCLKAVIKTIGGEMLYQTLTSGDILARL
jgi:hypothetical protein